MSKKEIVRRTVFLLPSLIVTMVIFFLLIKFIAQPLNAANNFSFKKIVKIIFTEYSLKLIINSIVLISITFIFITLLSFLFGLPKHGSVLDMWMSVLHIIFVSIPIFIFLFISTFIFSEKLKLLPSRSIYDLTSYILPVTVVAFLFSLYISFRIRYEKSILRNSGEGNSRLTLGLYFKMFSSDIGIFLSIIFVVEFFFFTNGLGYSLGYNLYRNNVTLVFISLFYVCLVFILLRYIFSLLAFACIRK